MLCGDTSCLMGKIKNHQRCFSVFLFSSYVYTSTPRTHTHTQAPPPSNLVIGVQKQHCKGYLNRTATQRQAKSQDSRIGTKRPNYMYFFSKKFFLCFILFYFLLSISTQWTWSKMELKVTGFRSSRTLVSSCTASVFPLSSFCLASLCSCLALNTFLHPLDARIYQLDCSVQGHSTFL